TQANLVFLLVDVQHLHLDRVPGSNYLVGVIDAARPAHLADVNEPLDAWFELDEGAVGHHIDDLTLVPAPDWIPGGHVLPPVRHQVLQRQGYLLALLVDGQDVDLQLFIDLDDLARIDDALPAHVGDVQKSVDATEVDEGAEVGDVLDDPLADLARLDLGQE